MAYLNKQTGQIELTVEEQESLSNTHPNQLGKDKKKPKSTADRLMEWVLTGEVKNDNY